MIITKVILKNYGVYGGKHKFDFAPTPNKPIILIGGANGSGKTTLFEAVMLCFYGISSVGKRITKKTYEKILAKKIHRCQKSATVADRASVMVQFRFFHNSREITYEIERSWQSEHGRMVERLDVRKCDSPGAKFEPLDRLEEPYWQSFIEDLIPRGIVKLFFFNGERVAKMAKEGTEDVTIRDSFKTLLGIEVVEQLYADLQTNIVRNLSRNDEYLQENLEKYESERNDAMSTVARLQERLAQKQTEMDSICTEIDSAESAISKLGGAFASRRDDIKSRLQAKQVQYETIRRRIMDMCSDVLPLALIPAELSILAGQIEEDKSAMQARAGDEVSNKRLDNVISKLKKETWADVGLSAKQRRIIMSATSSIIRAERASPKSGPNLVFGFSESQAMSIIGMIERANTILLPALKRETVSLVEADKEITTLETALASAPGDDEIGPLVSRVGELHSQSGELRAEMNHIEEKIASNKALQQHLNSKTRDLLSKAYRNKKFKEQIHLTQNVQTVLKEFIEKLRVKKTHLLEQYLLDATEILLHKRNFIKKVNIDPKTFEIRLYGKADRVISKDLLSEGEKQMFAMSVLWALAKTSGRPLPFMIDTPLARLDESHRANLVKAFLPTVSHQILVFSTDKEIEKAEQRKLEPYTTRSYVMMYDENDGVTRCREGYFWNRRGKRVVAV